MCVTENFRMVSATLMEQVGSVGNAYGLHSGDGRLESEQWQDITSRPLYTQGEETRVLSEAEDGM
jgi:hypothetical protein